MSGTISVEGQLREGSGSTATNDGFGVSVGLEGGAGGHSGTVTVANSADIQTNGEGARGIIAQSIGGDGGIAGSARVLTTGQADSLAVAVGGGGGSGATSAKVTVGNSGLIITKGKTSDGILAQSIGEGAASPLGLDDQADRRAGQQVRVDDLGRGWRHRRIGAVAGDVEVTNDGTISTENARPTASATPNRSAAAAALVVRPTTSKCKGADREHHERSHRRRRRKRPALAGVDVFNHGLIMTTGNGSSGISANSIGGGGGDAGSVSSMIILQAQEGGKTNAFELAVGGAGGSGGKGGAVHVVNAPNGTANSGTIITTNRAAHGIFAQSLGGGGGNGSSVLSISGSSGAKDSVSIGLNLGGAGGDGNTGGEVTVENAGLIHTKGESSIGILAQSSTAEAAMAASCCRQTSC
jgi:hypothetical protein